MDGGGSERQTVTLLQRIDRKIWSPELLLLYRRGVLLADVPVDIPVHAFWDEYTAPRIWFPGRIHRQQVAWLRKQLIERKPAAIYDRTYHATLITGPASTNLTIGRISTITSPPDVELVATRDNWIWIKRQRLARAYRSASFTVAVSKAVARAAERFYGLSKDAVVVVPNSIDLQSVREAANLRPPVSLDTRTFHIVCVGRMTEEKGHRFLLEAIQQLVGQNLPQFHLWLAGDGPLRPALERFVDSAGVSQQVSFLGHFREAVSLIANAQLLCLPSLYEGLPNVVMEAMAVGTPVIATSAGGSVELSENGKRFTLVPPGNSRALAESLKLAMTNPDPLVAMSKIAHAAIELRDCRIVLPQLSKLLMIAAGINED